MILPTIAEHATHVYHIYLIRTKNRDKLQNHLSENGIGSLIHYPIPPHLQKAYAHLGFKKGDFPIAEEIANTCLSLPMWPGMKKEMIGEIATALKQLYTQCLKITTRISKF